MKNRKRSITDEEIDALLSGTPLAPTCTFADKTLLKALPATDGEIDRLLSGELINISPDFTERTLNRIHSTGSAMIFEFPAMRWMIRSGLAAAVLLLGLFSFVLLRNHTTVQTIHTEVAQADLAGMELEELLFLEETLTSANVEVLIELQKTVPISYFIDEVDS